MTKNDDLIISAAKEAVEINRQQAIERTNAVFGKASTAGKRAEELAAEWLKQAEPGKLWPDLAKVLEQYGKEVREACAKVSDKSADGELDDYAAGGAYSAAEAIRAMPLP